MDITLHLMSEDEKPLLVRLMELYNYEFTEFSGDDIGEFGYYGYSHIDDYWTEAGRYPYLIRVDNKIAGFALVCPHCWFRTEENARSIGEFFVMLKYRKNGVGGEVARRLFDMHRGSWEITFWKNNLPAAAFWKKIVGEYTNESYRECEGENGIRTGLLFDNAK